jgi:uncharacterized SAM-binding protein YcdF (DUF218 family)
MIAAVQLRRSWTLLVLCLLAGAGLFFTSKVGATWLIALVEPASRPLSAAAAQGAQAIVLLTGGDRRTREAARLQRETGLPLLASGGDGEARAIRHQLQQHFGIPVRWTEERSMSTEENARFSADILARENIQRIILVTHALHMRRASTMFSDRQLEVVPAPADFLGDAQLTWRDVLPGSEGLRLTTSALHEIVGLAWYRIGQPLR